MQAVSGVGWTEAWLALTGHMDLVGERVASGLFPGPELELFRRAAAARLSGNSSRTYFRLLSSVARFDLRSRLGSIRAPTLVVAGEKDTTVALSAKTELAEHIPNAPPGDRPRVGACHAARCCRCLQ